MTAADVMIETLINWGVEVIFGFPGDGINGIFESIRTHADKIDFVQVRHEEAATFMAAGYAKFTGKLGVCLATSGPGGIHLLNGLYDAKMDGQPVLAITGMAFHDLIGTHGQQDVETDKLFMDVAIYNERVVGPAHVEAITEIACRTAETFRGVAHIAFPKDTQSMPYEPNHQHSQRSRPHHVSLVHAQAFSVPPESQLHRAAELLNNAKKVCILAGRGALQATDELEQAAELLGAPIVKALLGKAAVPDDSPYTTGSIGLLGTKPSEHAIRNCDLLFIIGSAFPYMEFLPSPGEAKCVQIELNPVRISLRYPADVGLVGDSKETLKLLLPRLKRKKDRGFLKKAQDGMKDWWEYMETLGTAQDKPMKPQVIAWELGKRLRNDAIVCCDSGTAATWFARQIRARRGQMYSLSGNLATMAVGLVKWEQMVMLGNPEYGVKLQPMHFSKFAEACGAYGMSVEDAAAVPNALDRFFEIPGPAVLEAVVDPLTAPLPPDVKPEQAIHFAESLVRGEPKARKIMKEAFIDKARELV